MDTLTDRGIKSKSRLQSKMALLIMLLLLFLLTILLLGKENIGIFFSFLYNLILIKFFGILVFAF